MLIKGYSDLKLRIPDCHSDSDLWAAEFKFDARDISEIFPYINAENEQARYFENPHYIQFVLNNNRCALYQDKVIIAPFKDRESAVEFINELTDYLNDLFDRKDSIQPDHNKYFQIPVLEIYKLLPRTNCGKCGSGTCMAFAASLSKRETAVSLCPELSGIIEDNCNSDNPELLFELKTLL